MEIWNEKLIDALERRFAVADLLNQAKKHQYQKALNAIRAHHGLIKKPSHLPKKGITNTILNELTDIMYDKRPVEPRQPTAARIRKANQNRAREEGDRPSGPYAILIAMYKEQLTQGADYRGFMHKDEIQRKAQPHCTHSMFRPNEYWKTCWDGIQKLEEERMVEREALSRRRGNFGQQKDRFFLLDKGEHMAKFLYQRDYGGDTTAGENDIGVRSLGGVQLNENGYPIRSEEICDTGACRYGGICDQLHALLETEQQNTEFPKISKEKRRHVHNVCEGINSLGAYPFKLAHESYGEGNARRLRVMKEQVSAVVTPEFSRTLTHHVSASSAPGSALRDLSLASPSPRKRRFHEINKLGDGEHVLSEFHRSQSTPSRMPGLAAEKRAAGLRSASESWMDDEDQVISLLSDSQEDILAFEGGQPNKSVISVQSEEDQVEAFGAGANGSAGEDILLKQALQQSALEAQEQELAKGAKQKEDDLLLQQVLKASEEKAEAEDTRSLTMCLVVDSTERTTNNDQMHIFNRLAQKARSEHHSDICKYGVEYKRLPLGDYLCAARFGTQVHDDDTFKDALVHGCLVERKTMKDLVQRSFMRDHERQIFKMKKVKEAVPYQFLVIEGAPSNASNCIVYGSGPRPDPKTSICDERGVYRLELSLILDTDHGMKVLITPNDEMTYRALWSIMKKLTEPRMISAIRKKKTYPDGKDAPSFQTFSHQCRALRDLPTNASNRSHIIANGSGNEILALQSEKDGLSCYTISRVLVVRIKGKNFLQSVLELEDIPVAESTNIWISSIIDENFDRDLVQSAFYKVKLLIIDGLWRAITTKNIQMRSSQTTQLQLDDLAMAWVTSLIVGLGYNVHLSDGPKNSTVFLETIQNHFIPDQSTNSLIESWVDNADKDCNNQKINYNEISSSSEESTVDLTVGWSCNQCTFFNEGSVANAGCCGMCESPYHP